jgi:hypothetical protein
MASKKFIDLKGINLSNHILESYVHKYLLLLSPSLPITNLSTMKLSVTNLGNYNTLKYYS